MISKARIDPICFILLKKTLEAVFDFKDVAKSLIITFFLPRLCPSSQLKEQIKVFYPS